MASTLQSMFAFPKTLTALVGVSIPITYLIYLHKLVSRHVGHERVTGTVNQLDAQKSYARFLSVTEKDYEDNSQMIYDQAWKSVRLAELPKQIPREEYLTLFLRHTMILFSTRLPQAYLLRLVAQTPEQKASFRRDVIEKLDFLNGDVVNGLYRVVRRTSEPKEDRVEFAMQTPGAVRGRLAFKVEWENDMAVFRTETLMWKPSGAPVIMPLERPLFGWLHELASRWLLVKGRDYLSSLR